MGIWQIKNYQTLSIQELYALLQLRSEVYVVEQNCVYQDLDNKDQHADHLLYFEDSLLACARLFAPGHYFKDASIGRVVVKKDRRGQEIGHELMRRAITYLDNKYQTTITISAQQYLEHFYNQHGFMSVGGTYLEDGIPHIRMVR